MKRTPEVRLNGVGMKYLGIKNESGKITGTYWFTFLYMPIFPILKATIQYPNKNSIIALERHKLQIGEILKTYLYGWIIFPILCAGPLVLGAVLLAEFENGMPGFLVIILGIAWISVCIWKLADWDDHRRGLK